MRQYENDFDSEFFNRQHDDAAAETADASAPAEKKGKQYIFTKKSIAAVTALCIVVSCVFGAGSAMVATKAMQDGSTGRAIRQTSYAIPMNADLSAATGSKLSVQQIIDKTANAVVEINVQTITNNAFFGQYVRPGAGSGVIITADGYIMTNNHVTSNSSTVSVTLRDGTKYDAKVVGYDSQTDVAILKIDAKGLTPVVFGDSDTILVGDLAVAIGNPLGQLGGTATTGIISSLDRQINIEGKTMTLLQTDAAINPGNSGGGLFNQYGELVGLVVAKSQGLGVEGLGFAIPVNQIKNVASQLMTNGYVKGRPQIGIEMVNLTSAQDAIQYGVRNLGVYVSKVISDGAQKAGFKEGDMLYYIDDTKITQPTDLTDALQKHSVGDKVKITVVRGDQMVDLTVVLGEQQGAQ